MTSCSTASRNVDSNVLPDRFNSHEHSVSRPLMIADTVSNEMDSLTVRKPMSLMDLPESQDGEIILSEGFYEADFKSYCLQPGTPSPSDHDAYMQSHLNSYRKDIVETILRNSLKRPDLEQKNIQLLLWSVVSGSDFDKLSGPVRFTGRELLSRKQIFQLQGGVIGVIKQVSNTLSEAGLPANNSMKQLFEKGANSYEQFERLAVLQQPSEIKHADIKKDQWYKQDNGYYLRYFPSSYQNVKIQVYVPKGTLDSSVKKSQDYLLFDPVTMMAVPANSNSQRLGIGAPVVDILRKIIQIQKIPPPKKPPVKNKNSKNGV